MKDKARALWVRNIRNVYNIQFLKGQKRLDELVRAWNRKAAGHDAYTEYVKALKEKQNESPCSL
jgi:hypothetical protein